MTAGCASRSVLDSPRANSQPAIDGSDADWQGRLEYVESAGLSVAATHDDRFLYLVLATSDRQLQGAILGRGLTVWLDGTGGDERRLGLRYPTGLADAWGQPSQRPSREGAAPGAADRPGVPPQDELARREQLLASLATLPAEFLLFRGADDSGRLVGLGERAAPGLELSLGLEGSRLVYELRFPLQGTPGAMLPDLGLSGDRLGLGLQLAGGPEGRSGRRGGAPFGGDLGGGMGGGPGRMGGGSGMGSPPPGERSRGPRDAPELDTWLVLHLVP